MPLRIGLAGLGIHGGRYARHLLAGEVAGARLVAVCRADARAGSAWAREHGLHFVGEPEALATHPEIDAVVLVLPPHLHAGAAVAALEAGKPVLVEKPLAADRRSALAVVEARRRHAGWLMAGHTLRFDAVVARLREEVAGLGKLRLVAINQRFEPTTRPWIDEPVSGGILLNTGVHGFDLMRHLTGLEPVAVAAETGRASTRRTDDGFAGTVRLEPGGVLATIDNLRSTRARSGRIEIVGEHGQVWGDHVHRTLEVVREGRRRDLGPVEPSPTIPAALDAFVGCVRRGEEPPVTAADGLAAVEMVEAAARSAREGRRVGLDEVRRDSWGGPTGVEA